MPRPVHPCLRVSALALTLFTASAASAAEPTCSSPLEASFAHELREGRHVTSTGIDVPAPLAEVDAVLADITSYPRWLFSGPDGAQTLHDVKWDGATGAFSLLIGAGGKGLPLVGHLEIISEAAGITVRAHGSDEDIKEWSFELKARLDPACAERSLLTLRIDIVFSLKARLFGGSANRMPLLIALAARDDLAAAFLTTPERLRALGIASISSTGAGKPAFSIEGAAPVEVLSCHPGSIAVGTERATAFGKLLEDSQRAKKPEVGALLDATTQTITGRHPVVSWRLAVAGRPEPINVEISGDKMPGLVHADAHVVPQEKGFSLSFGVGVSK